MVSPDVLGCNMIHGVATVDTLPHDVGSRTVRTYGEVLLALVELRKRAKLTQAQLAERMNVAASTISAWETNTNKMDVDQLAAYAKACEHVLRVDVYRKGESTREQRLLSATDGLNEPDLADLLEVVRVLKDAHPDARHMALSILKSAATTPR